MKAKHSFVSIAAVLLLCVSLAVCVSAATITHASTNAGIYLSLTGTISPSSGTSLLPTTTTVSVNPDQAYLKVDLELKNGVDHISNSTASSSTGVTTFSHTMPIYYYAEEAHPYVYVAHNVQGGSQSDFGYVCRTQSPLY